MDKNTSTARNALLLSLYTTPRTITDTAQMLSFAACKNSTTLTSLYCSIRSRVEVNFVDVCGFDAHRGSPELQQVRLPVRLSRRCLRCSLRTHTSVLLYSDTVLCPGDNSICFGERYRDVLLYQILDENNTQTSTDCCTVVLRT